MSHETFDLIDQLRRSGKRSTMATLVRTIGTTPRKEGTKMFVGEGGAVFGSVTIGGCVDARVIEHAGEVLRSSTPRLLNLQLGDEEAWEIGLTCGGAVEVFLEPLNEEAMTLYDTARREWQAGRTIAIATVIAGENVGRRSIVADPPPRSGTTTLDGRDVYIEVLRPPSTLLIFGAGAVAIPLVGFAKALGFRTIVIDGRPRFATRERFPQADEIRVGIASEIAEQIEFGPMTPVVLVAHDYKYDVPLLKRALATDVPYIGLLGSRRRGAAILQMIRDEGAPEKQVQRVRVPIGLDVGGETVAEIALSIIAEVVAVIHGRSGAALSTRPAAEERLPVVR
jgi:xanthine dehydrogenase accessory factor